MTKITIDPSQPLIPPPAPSNSRKDQDAFADRLAEAGDRRPAAASAKQSDKPRAEPAEPADQAEQGAAAADVEGRDADSQDDAEQTDPPADNGGEAVVRAPVVAEQAVLELPDEVVVDPAVEAVAEAGDQEQGETTEQPAKAQTEPQPPVPAPSTDAVESGSAELQASPEAADAPVEQPPAAPAEETPAATEESSDQEDTKAEQPPLETDLVVQEEVAAEEASAEQAPPSQPQEKATSEPGSANDDAEEKQPAPQATATDKQSAEHDDPRQEPAASDVDGLDADKPQETELQNAQPSADAAESEAAPEAAPAEQKTETSGPPQQNHNGSLERLASSRFGVAKPSEAAAGPPETQVDPARFVGRVSRAFEAANQRGGEVRLRLNPPELGAMQIKLSISSEGAMHASVETETTSARNALLDNLPALRERLAEMDIRIEKFDVDVQRDGSGRQDWTANQERRDQQQARRLNTPAGAVGKAVETLASPPPPSGAASLGPDQINLVA